MSDKNLVVFKGTGDGITVLMDDLADFDLILSEFMDKLKASKKFFKGSKVSIRFKGRTLSKDEQDKLLNLLRNQNILNISFLHELEEDLIVNANQSCDDQISHTHFHYGIVRSGQHIQYNGNVVVLGDVNPGGLVTAGGNIIILGALKGKVHAGLNLNVSKPFVVALGMFALQIGLRNIVAQSPDGDTVYGKKEMIPQIAYIQEDQIYVDQIDLKSIQDMLK
jgi:septum site-determining protein MinC